MNKNVCHVTMSVQLTEEFKKRFIALADEMAGAYCDKSSQGYDNLIRSRAELQKALDGVMLIEVNS